MPSDNNTLWETITANEENEHGLILSCCKRALDGEIVQWPVKSKLVHFVVTLATKMNSKTNIYDQANLEEHFEFGEETASISNPPLDQSVSSTDNALSNDCLVTDDSLSATSSPTPTGSSLPEIAVPISENQSICKSLLQGQCKHGISGKKDGVCSSLHPRICSHHLRNGRFRGGCKLSKQLCPNLHIFICPSSYKQRSCYNEECTFMHLKGTTRIQPKDNQQPSLGSHPHPQAEAFKCPSQPWSTPRSPSSPSVFCQIPSQSYTIPPPAPTQQQPFLYTARPPPVPHEMRLARLENQLSQLMSMLMNAHPQKHHQQQQPRPMTNPSY